MSILFPTSESVSLVDPAAFEEQIGQQEAHPRHPAGTILDEPVPVNLVVLERDGGEKVSRCANGSAGKVRSISRT